MFDNNFNQHFFQFPFSLFIAYQNLRSERENCLDFLSAILKCRIEKQTCTLRCLWKENRQRIWLILDSMLNYLWKNKLVHGYIVLKNKDVVSAKYCVWPHLWPSTDSDYVETVLTRALESTVLDTKASKITRNYTKNLCRTLRDTEYTSSNILSFKLPLMPWNKRVSGLFNFFSKNAKFPLWPHVLTTYEKT